MTGQAIWIGFNDFATTHPHLTKEMHPTKNGDLKPTELMAGSTKNIWWYLPYDDLKTGKHFDFEWQSTIDNRANKDVGCPYLSNPARAVWPGFNDFASQHPELLNEWDYEKNTVSPTAITCNSNKKVWWKMYYYDKKTNKTHLFEWEETVQNRATLGFGCPYLSNRKIKGDFNSLAVTHPDLLNEWDYDKNDKLGIKPTEVSAGSPRKVWWKIVHDGEIYSWKSAITSRVRGSTHPLLSESNLEKVVTNILLDFGIFFKREHCTENCLSPRNNKMRFDFVLPEHNAIIECDGRQHFQAVDYFGGTEEFNTRTTHDNIKNEYAFSNAMLILRIPHIYDPIKNKKEIYDFVLALIENKSIPSEIVQFYSQFEFSNYATMIQKCDIAVA